MINIKATPRLVKGHCHCNHHHYHHNLFVSSSSSSSHHNHHNPHHVRAIQKRCRSMFLPPVYPIFSFLYQPCPLQQLPGVFFSPRQYMYSPVYLYSSRPWWYVYLRMYLYSFCPSRYIQPSTCVFVFFPPKTIHVFKCVFVSLQANLASFITSCS